MSCVSFDKLLVYYAMSFWVLRLIVRLDLNLTLMGNNELKSMLINTCLPVETVFRLYCAGTPI